MYNTEDFYEINIKLLPAQVDLLLNSLELFAFNFHNTWSVNIDSREEELRNALIFHTYESILSKYNNSKSNYNVLKECQLKHYRDRQNNFKKLKKSA